MTLKVEIQDTKFRVKTQDFSTRWLPDTESNRKTVVVMLRYLVDREGKALFTFGELSTILGSDNRQASSSHIEIFRERGEDFERLVLRKKKLDEKVISAVEKVLSITPLGKLSEIAEQVNKLLEREDISVQNIETALEQIGYKKIRKILKRQLESGKIQYKEEYLIDHLFEMVSKKAEEGEEISVPLENQIEKASPAIESALAEPRSCASSEEAIFPLLKSEVSKENLSSIWESEMGWKLWAFLLYFQGVSLSAIGDWLGIHKSTVCRWLSKVADWAKYLTPSKIEFSGRVSVDEKWLKVDGVWQYLFAAVDCVSGYPLHIALYPSNNGNYCKLFLLELRNLGYIPKVIITDGWDAYIQAILSVFPEAEHLYCRFHVLCSVFRRLKKWRMFESNWFRLVGKLFQTSSKRTVLRRVKKLEEALGEKKSPRILGGLLKKLPKLLRAVGSTWLPSTSNAVESFFSVSSRFYRSKGPFCDEASAKKHIKLFLLGYLFKIGVKGQPCPLEKAGVTVAKLPLYHLINRPNVLALKERMTEQYREAA